MDVSYQNEVQASFLCLKSWYTVMYSVPCSLWCQHMAGGGCWHVAGSSEAGGSCITAVIEHWSGKWSVKHCCAHRNVVHGGKM